mgnify:CR=1 FL=1
MAVLEQSRRDFLRTAGLGAAAFAMPRALRAVAPESKRPNILFLFTDDQRHDTIGALGNPHIKPPPSRPPGPPLVHVLPGLQLRSQQRGGLHSGPQHGHDRQDMVPLRRRLPRQGPRPDHAQGVPSGRHLHDYYAVITGMDHELDRLIQSIDDLGLSGSTLIVFSSDQGIALGSHGLMGKQSLYEDVQKVPLLIAGPGIKPGSSDAFAYLHDLLSTFCELADLPAPENIDGISLAPVLAGKQTAVRDTITLAYCDTQRSVRNDRWKLIRLPQINKSMLFDLANDPHETTDLASDPEKNKIMERMTAMLRKEQQRLGDTLPLTAVHPKPAAFTPRKPRIKTAFPAGGLAPGAGPRK